jgi:3',5'-cyclic AMP phosphodiesterase CpdA
MAEVKLLHISDLHFGSESNFQGLDFVRSKIFSIEGLVSPVDTVKTVMQFADQVLSAPSPRKAFQSPSSHRTDQALELARWAWRNANKSGDEGYDFDLIALTGDLARTGEKSELLKARGFLGEKGVTPKPLREVGYTLGHSRVPILALPGNHDRYEDVFATPDAGLFDSVFDDVWRGGSARVSEQILALSGQELAFVSADFSLRQRNIVEDYRSKWAVFGQGEVDETVRDLLEDVTKKLREAPARRPIIWLLHFPLLLTDDRDLALLGWQQLTSIAARYEVDAILCGHIHQKRAYMLGSTWVHCAGTACAVDAEEPNSFHHLNLSVEDGRVNRCVVTDFVWDTSARGLGFVATPCTVFC